MRSDGFTLIEIMVVIILIAAVATMVVPFMVDESENMKVEIAKGDMRSIDTALKVYRLKQGKYPGDLSALLSRGDGKGGPYLESDPVDPWKNKYHYKYPGSRDTVRGYDLYSYGPNGMDNGGDGDDIRWDRAAR